MYLLGVYGRASHRHIPSSRADCISIVFVHGLRGGRESTWTKDGVIWPKELLSKDIPKSRILSFGYDSGVVHSDIAEVTQGSLADDARSLCSLLDDVRKKTNTVR
jgi:protein SERAC1